MNRGMSRSWDQAEEPLDGFRFMHRQPVVLRDLDAFGHVNNAVYLTYIENARVAYLKEVVGASRVEEIRNIMASATITYRAPANYGDVIEIGVRVDRVGTKSFVLVYGVSTSDGRHLADATSVQVMFDYEREETIPFPADWLALVERYEQASRLADGTLSRLTK